MAADRRTRAIFLDDGEVMNDNARRGPQWQRLVGTYLAPRLGGSQAAWERANLVVAERLWAEDAKARQEAGGDFGAYHEHYLGRWVRDMCEEVRVDAPAGRDACVLLAREVSAYVTRRVHADYPGAVEAIRQLHAAGYALHTSSNEFAADLEGYLEAMGVRHCFGTLYGSDVIGATKHSPGYYERLFTHAAVSAEQALVVDDKESFLEGAAALGARTVLCGSLPPRDQRHAHIECLAHLPGLLGQ